MNHHVVRWMTDKSKLVHARWYMVATEEWSMPMYALWDLRGFWTFRGKGGWTVYAWAEVPPLPPR